MIVRGIEHIGLTVSDLPAAEQFFINALGASVLYRIVPSGQPDKQVEGKDMTPLNGFPPEMKVVGLVMMRLGNGCNVELFQIDPGVDDKAANISQAGVNHFSIYVDDINQAGEALRRHGGEMFDGPNPCFAQEEGEGNQTWFCHTPFGVLIELITLPSSLHYDKEATDVRWLPDSTAP
ncbi:VOC family protein [Erwinia sp. HDF1-3R]|uniref:VOC family protein n=1 Tax=Erwinia sp. HDF1-3R TaxID=3141543 RepID=UPI0031F56214